MSEHHRKSLAECEAADPAVATITSPALQQTQSIIPLPWQMLGLALLGQITVSIIGQGVPILAPFIQADLALTRGQVGLCNSAIMAGSLTAMAVAGWMVDIKGERAALIWGNVIVGAFCFLVAAAGGLFTTLVALFAVGIGAAFPTPAGSKTVMVWFPVEQRGTAMGIRQTGIPVGGALAAAMLPALSLYTGWRIAVVVGGMTCFVTVAACWLLYRQPDTAPAAMSPMVQKKQNQWREILTRDIALLGLAGALLPLGQFALLTYLALYLQETQGIPITTSAVFLVGAQIAGAAGRIVWGMWSDRWFRQRRKPALVWANLLAAGVSLVLGWLPQGVPVWVVGLIVLVYAFNAIGWHGSWIALIAELAGPEKQGRTLGLALTIMYPGIIVCPPVFGWFVDYTHSWPMAWTLLAGVLAIGTALIVPVRESQRT